MPSTPDRWVLLAYRLPREPSTPRIAVWRRLRRLGALQLVDGLVALPHNADTQEQLEWLAGEIGEAGGESTMWIAEPVGAGQQRDLAGRLRDAAAADYRAVIEAARAAREHQPDRRGRSVARLRRSLRTIRARDHFPPPERGEAETAVEELAASQEARL